jgi:hypothetical protein
MRAISALLTLGLLGAAGCNMLPHKRDLPAPSPAAARTPPPPAPEPTQLVRYLNENAVKIQGLKADDVAMDCKQGLQSVGLDGYLACSWPRNFRLRAKALGQPAADIGSNDNEFWFWISKADPPYVYHCSYQDFARGVRTPFPFQPEMVMSALGLAQFDPNKAYRVRETQKHLELIEETTTAQGQPAERVTVFNRMEVRPDLGQPQVVAHILKDKQGGVIAQAVVHKVAVDRQTGAVVPQSVTLSWPAQRMEMQIHIRKAVVMRLDPASDLFQRSSLNNLQSYDLARQVVDGPGVQRTGGIGGGRFR